MSALLSSLRALSDQLDLGNDSFTHGLLLGSFVSLVIAALIARILLGSRQAAATSAPSHPSGNSISPPSRPRRSSDAASPASSSSSSSSSHPVSFWPGVQELGRMFRRWDADKDGRLSLHEFQSGVRSLGLEIPNDRAIAVLMTEMDADHGGFIDEDEFVGTLRRYTRESLQQRMLDAAAGVGGVGGPTATGLPASDRASSDLIHFHVLGKTALAGVFESHAVTSIAGIAHVLRTCMARAAELADEAVVWVDLGSDCASDAALDAITAAAALPLSLARAMDYSFAGECRSVRAADSVTAASGASGLNWSPVASDGGNGGGDISSGSARRTPSASAASAPHMTPTLCGARGPRLRHVAHLVGTALSLSSTPIQVDEIGRAPSLVADSVYERRRASLLRQPVHLFIAGPTLLITVRPPSIATAADADSSVAAAASGLGAAHVWSDILSEMRAQPELLTQGAVQTNAVGLCAKLCAELVDFNFATYDLLKDWQRALKEAIEATTLSSRSTAIRALVAAHLFDCESISQEMLFASAPMLGVLRSLAENDMDEDETSEGDRCGDERGAVSMLTRSDKKWGRSVRSAAGSGGEPSSSAARRGSKLKRALSGSGLTLPNRADRSATIAAATDEGDDDGVAADAVPAFSLAADSTDGESGSGSLSGGSGATHLPKSLLRRHLAPSFAFSASEHAASFDLAAGAQARLNMHLRTVVERCETLAERHTSAQTQMTNATLFRLSALQGITFPLTLLTGLYGMNFVHMPELQWKYSYFCFLGASALYIFFAARWYLRQLKALGLSTHG